jgi:hypothetical protein
MEKYFVRMLTIGVFVWSGMISTVAAADAPRTAATSTPVVLSALAQIAAAGVAAQYDKAEQCFVKGKEAGLSEL